ncbi:hypothetical protein LTR97_007321 [Elasticomyces elasticus]|uniref:Cytochrome b5 heme-binding domain-containing protein n=1 Tax=Elasticomyces elasticus TaxID=574655 RepID=A0AAN7W078_9PEZI|nr:hypothetical protein LTR97_007321 [Elasticomyces elasticus]
MGRLRLSAFRPRNDQVEELPAITMSLVDDEKAQRAEHIEHFELINEANVGPDAADYHILPKRTPVEDLPFIASTEVAKRNGKEGRRLWIVVDSTVLDVTDYQQKHPGGRQIIAGFGGQDCSWQVGRARQ